MCNIDIEINRPGIMTILLLQYDTNLSNTLNRDYFLHTQYVTLRKLS